MKAKRRLINSWVDKAGKDLLTAEHELSFSDAVTESICFHCQQAVEKYLKAYLIFLGIPFTKTHEIGELITRCETKDKLIFSLKIEADKLTDYAVEIRYPDAWSEPKLDEAKEAFKIGTKIRDYVLNIIT
ncbi:MAG: HEPN domain-containing protein [Candidatus Eremiobacteraeota bacterium]|nr:HEPN domain-containing protein [Candidatus Eremiobacteraeota bacterium]